MKKHFTLLELSLATGILAMILVIATMSVSAAYQTWQKVSLNEQKMQQLYAIDSIVESGFRNAVSFSWYNKNRQKVICFEGEEEAIMFPYLHRITNRKNGAIRFIKLEVVNGNLTATYRHTPMIPDEYANDNNLIEEVIATKVKSISFLYGKYDKKELIWLDKWDNQKEKNIPVAIQMEVKFEDNTTQVWLRRTAGNEYYRELGAN